MATLQAASNRETATLKNVSGKLHYRFNISHIDMLATDLLNNDKKFSTLYLNHPNTGTVMHSNKKRPIIL